MRALILMPLVLLAACSPRDMADSMTRKTAGTVVQPVVAQWMTGPQADQATGCITAAASPEELQLLLRDIGTRAGTDTVRNVKAIAKKPQAQACLAGLGLPPIPA